VDDLALDRGADRGRDLIRGGLGPDLGRDLDDDDDDIGMGMDFGVDGSSLVKAVDGVCGDVRDCVIGSGNDPGYVCTISSNGTSSESGSHLIIVNPFAPCNRVM
jgi:hypothetical protein